MATDAGDWGGIAGSTAQGAAAGSWAGPVGIAIGGTIGFIQGLFNNEAESAAEDLQKQQIENAKVAAGLQGEAREVQIQLNRLQADRARRQLAQRAFLAQEGVRAGEAITGLVDSSIARNARASAKQQLASNLQFSFLTQEMGEQISALQQKAAEAAVDVDVPEEAGLFDKYDTGTAGDFLSDPTATNFVGAVGDTFGGGGSGLGSIDTGSDLGNAALNTADFLLGPVDEAADAVFDFVGGLFD